MGELTLQNGGSNKLLSSLLQEQASAREHKENLFSSIEHLMDPLYFKQTSLKFVDLHICLQFMGIKYP